MLITFRTKAYSDITMFGDVALKLIRAMGHSGTVPGALGADEVARALTRLRTFVQADKELQADVRDDRDEAEGERRVSLAHRALPLIEMLEAAARQGAPVMWDR